MGAKGPHRINPPAWIQKSIGNPKLIITKWTQCCTWIMCHGLFTFKIEKNTWNESRKLNWTCGQMNFANAIKC